MVVTAVTPIPILNLLPPVPAAASTSLFQTIITDPNLGTAAYDLFLTSGAAPGDTTLLQSEYPAALADTTILQAEIDAGMAVAADNQPTAPAPVTGPEVYLDRAAPAPGAFQAELEALAAAPGGAQAAADLLEGDGVLAALTPPGTAGSGQPPGPVAGGLELPPTLPVVPSNLLAPAILPDAGGTPLPTAAAQLQAEAEAAAAQEAAAPDLQAQDILAQAQQVLQAQETILAALRGGAGDVALLLSGLPAGATANLLGGGLTPALPGPTAAQAFWAFQFPFYGVDIPAVTSPTRTEPSRDEDKPPGGKGAPLTVYGPKGEKEPPLGQGFTSTLDILD